MLNGGESKQIRTHCLLWVCASALIAHSAFGQSQAQPSATPSTMHVAGWTVSGSLRVRFEQWDSFKAQSGYNRYGYGASLPRVSAGRQFRSADLLFELEQPSLIGLPNRRLRPLRMDNWVSAARIAPRTEIVLQALS